MEKKDNLKIDSNTVVHCKTEKLVKQVLQVTNDLGHKCDGKDSYTGCSAYETYQSETTFNLHVGCYCSLSFYRSRGYKVISAKEFLKLHGKWEERSSKQEDISKWDVSNAHRLKRPLNKPKPPTKITIVTKDGVVTLKEVEWHFPKDTTYETAKHITLYADDCSAYDFSQHEPKKQMSAEEIIEIHRFYGGAKTESEIKELIDSFKNIRGEISYMYEEGECQEESPYNEDGSIKIGWLCEFWDDVQTHSRHFAFYDSSAGKIHFSHSSFNGDNTRDWDNCRPIPRSEWADWAVEAHKTLKL